jgi:hypothetical protein
MQNRQASGQVSGFRNPETVDQPSKKQTSWLIVIDRLSCASHPSAATFLNSRDGVACHFRDIGGRVDVDVTPGKGGGCHSGPRVAPACTATLFWIIILSHNVYYGYI